ncbi:hypothetical protein [Saccharothrix obliqua]|uniref:hypothetical protein n=1 Tax=Saccharothrix obliqua TaxID=2861747 RepID=UPI001C5E8087|nr:hypothetical protein [Saccharothrix obliqua]MBW4721095.1 hypothetical protein [Saccharothrix obliqua]
MSIITETESEPAKRRAARAVPGAGTLPTAPCSVVWSKGHAYVLEGFRARWVGVDDRGRPSVLSGEQLQRRGWSRTRSR